MTRDLDQEIDRLHLMILGAISKLPEEDRKKIKECAERLAAIIVEYDVSQRSFAITLMNLETAKEL